MRDGDSMNEGAGHAADAGDLYAQGNALCARSRFDEAIACYLKVITVCPDHVGACASLGRILMDRGHAEEAALCCRQILAFHPEHAEAHGDLGNALLVQGKISEAIDSYRRALQLDPGLAGVYSNLGNAMLDLGRVNEAIACHRQALKIKPDSTDAYSNLLFTLDLSTESDTALLQAERRGWDAAYAASLYEMSAFTNVPDPERRLRIGYVSADCREHSAAVVFGAMLVDFDASVFDVFVYSNSLVSDDVTQRFRACATGWRDIAGQSSEAVAELIRQDQIDILVDLSGHSRGNRLHVFARKPAPIQITAWGYAGGTGMRAMDVFFADPVVVPPEEKSLYAEDVRYLPNVVSAFFPNEFPAVEPLPATLSAGITFGSLNRLCKVSPEAWQTWAKVLLEVPGSRMIVKAGDIDHVGTRERVLANFARAGVDPARIELIGKSRWRDHVAVFNRIDIALDPYPHGGGVTTLEGLMMGVPVVTLRWPTLPGRLSSSILTTLALDDWIAETPEQYVGIAVRKAEDIAALADLRGQLRNRFRASIIGDNVAYVRAVEREYRQLWRDWCVRQVSV